MQQKRPRYRVSGLVVAPTVAFVLMAFFAWGLFSRDDALPSAMVDKSAPKFTLPHILETGNDSYRFKASSEAAKKTAKEKPALTKT